MASEGATIEYATAVDDVVAFNQFHMKVSRTGRRTQVTVGVTAAVLTFFLSLGLIAALNSSVLSHDPVGLRIILPIAAVGSLIVAMRARRMIERSVNKSVRRMLAEGQNKSLLGWHRIALGERGLRVESEVSSSEVLFGALERVEETEAHVFIYTGATSAYVVPKAAVTVGELAPFVAEIKRRTAEAA